MKDLVIFDRPVSFQCDRRIADLLTQADRYQKILQHHRPTFLMPTREDQGVAP